jgi:UDP-N-acetylglucosamine:LPS N-acetylglucosamine transferase
MDGFVLREVLGARTNSCPEVPVVMVITGFILNKQCVSKQIDKYFVDNEDVKKQLENEGIDAKKIVVSDMPICPSFDKNFDKKQIMDEYEIDKNKPTVLLAVPSADNAGIKDALDDLKTLKDEFNIIADCGHDRAMYVSARDRGIQAVNEGADSNSLYSIADVVVGRPILSSVAKAYYRNSLYFALPPKGEEEKRTAEYLSASLISIGEKPKKNQPLIVEDTLNYKLMQLKNEPKLFNDIYKAIAKHNDKRPRGRLFVELDNMIK